MTKVQLLDQIAADAEVTKAQAKKMLDSLIGSVKKVTKKGDKLSLIGFGTFSQTKRKARKGRNPHTGEALKIPAAKLPKFAFSKAFKEEISGK